MKKSLSAITALTAESAVVNRSTNVDEERGSDGEQKRRKKKVETEDEEEEDEDEEAEEEGEEEDEGEGENDVEGENELEVDVEVKQSVQDLNKKDKKEYKGREADKSRARHGSSISLFYTPTLDIDTTAEEGENVNDAPYSPSSTW
jgi:hypothetical protein